MNQCQTKLYTSILARLAARGEGPGSVLAKHAPLNRREWLLLHDGDEPREYQDLWTTRLKNPREIIRNLCDNIDCAGDAECWNYLGYCNPYGQTYVMRAIVRSHVLIYDLWNSLPENYGGKETGCLAVRHTCDNPCCNNPLHLCIGTVADNIRDARSRGRHMGINFYKKKNQEKRAYET